MFDFIAATIEQLKSRANEWYTWLWPEEGAPESQHPVPSAEPPIAEAPPAMVPQPIDPTPEPPQPRNVKPTLKSAPARPPQQRPIRHETPERRSNVRRAPVIASGLFSARGRNLEYLLSRVRGDVRQTFFAGRIVGYTGRQPYDAADIEILIRRLGGILGFDGLWEPGQLMIIGREAFSSTYLKHSVEAGMRYGFECVYMSQDALTGLLQFGTLPNYYRGDARIRDHAGLRCVANFGFVWPTTDVAARSDNPDEEDSGEWRTYHELVSVYGYRVDARTGLTVAQRQERLRRAVTGLGLRCVAEHIAANIKLAKNRRHANMESAIENWHDDLDWLRQTFYQHSAYRFVWPHVYRDRRKAS